MDSANQTAIEMVPLNSPKTYEYYNQYLSNKTIKSLFLTPQKLFRKTVRNNMYSGGSEFEEIVSSNEDRSATISLILRKFEDEKFWTNEMLDFIMQHLYHKPSANVKNLFSLLMYDWHEQCEQPQKSYFLKLKFDAFKRASNKKALLFEKLFGILNDDNKKEFHYVCEKIIYFFVEEQNWDKNIFSNHEIQFLISKALAITNSDYKNKVLKVLVTFLDNKVIDKTYLKFKNQIFLTFSTKVASMSVLKISYNSVVEYCDGMFFKLVFLLKENSIADFKISYKKFIAAYQTFFGEYWSTAIKLNSQLLFIIANNQCLIETQEFILIETPELNLKSSVCDIFRNIAEFQAVFNEPLDKKDQDVLEFLTVFLSQNFIYEKGNIHYSNNTGFKNIFKNNKQIRRLLFGRSDFKSKSLFEDILSKSELARCLLSEDFTYVIDYIWSEFRLWDKPEVLTLKNCLMKTPMDYVLETENDSHFITFLMLDPSDYSNEICKPLHYMMLKNILYFDCKKTQNDNKCLIEYHLHLIEKNNRRDYDNLHNLMYLLEEVTQYGSDNTRHHFFFINHFKTILSETHEKYDGKNELKLPRKHFLLGLMMIYLGYYAEYTEKAQMNPQRNDSNYLLRLRHIAHNFSETPSFEEFIPFFKLLSFIINKQQDVFEREFPKEIITMENSFKNLYNLKNTYDNSHQRDNKNEIFHFYEKYSTSFSFILLYAAIKTNQKGIIKMIFDFNNFLISIPVFPSNMKVGDTHHYTARLFLEKRYEIGRDVLPKNWITHNVLENFLNSCISCQNGYYRVDCRFLLPYYNYDCVPYTAEDINNDLIINEDYDSMEYILNNHDLKTLVTHPVLETVIRIKRRKYSDLAFWNFVIFIVTYVLPTAILVFLCHSENYISNNINKVNNSLNSNDEESTTLASNEEQTTVRTFEIINYKLMFLIILIRLPYITIREYIQYKIINQNEYAKKRSNYIECGLILTSTILLILTSIQHFRPTEHIFIALVAIEAINVVLTIIATTFLFPFLKFTIYMKCFEKVFMTYLHIFMIFLPFLVGCAGLTFIIFDKNLGGEIAEFHNFGNASMKYIMMFSGEYEIDPGKLSGFLQGAAITLILILIINKANLILSIVVNDVQTVMQKAKEFNLNFSAKRYIELSKSIRKFYAVHIDVDDADGLTNQNHKKIKKRNLKILQIIKKQINKYPYTHRIQILYVDKITGEILVDTNIPIFSTHLNKNRAIRKVQDSGLFYKLNNFWQYLFTDSSLDAETMKNIEDIVAKNNDAEIDENGQSN